jgi:hypothetical protein
MGVCNSQYRLVIGLFNNCKFVILKSGLMVRLLFVNIIFVILILLLLALSAGDIHRNPGPNGTKFCKMISMCHVNIRSLSRSKVRAIQTSLTSLYDIITLSETHLHNGVTNDVFKLNGHHNIIRKDRLNQGGGVAIYVKENILYKRMLKYEKPNLEALWLQVNTIEGKVLICCCYRPPNDSTFWDEIQLVLDDVKTDKVKYIYILGDINADFNTPNGRKLNMLCVNNNLQRLINEQTRITASTATVLDQIITNASNFVNKIEVTAPVSTNDHCTVSVLLNFKVHKENAHTCIVWQYGQADFA